MVQMAPRKSVSVDKSAVLLVVAAATCLMWLLPLILGKYSDTSFPYIPAEDIVVEVLDVTDLQQGLPGTQANMNSIHKTLEEGDHKSSLLTCPQVSPTLQGLRLSLYQYADEWTPESVEKYAALAGIQPGGFWQPVNCKARYAVTVIVGQRNRTEQLQMFLLHMHAFLARQQLRYRIVVVEQDNSRPYNRGKLFNIGFAESRKLSVGPEQQCVVMQDVDLLPLHDHNLYACTSQPRHMTVAVDSFRFELPYRQLAGGGVALLASQMEQVNGFSNSFSGWGGEDDDFSSRLQQQDLQLVRFDPSVSLYTMLHHAPAPPAADRFQTMEQRYNKADTDGLSSLQYTVTTHSNRMHPLMTHIAVTW